MNTKDDRLTKRLFICLTAELHGKVQTFCGWNNLSMSQFVREAIVFYGRHQEQEQKKQSQTPNVDVAAPVQPEAIAQTPNGEPAPAETATAPKPETTPIPTATATQPSEEPNQ